MNILALINDSAGSVRASGAALPDDIRRAIENAGKEAKIVVGSAAALIEAARNAAAVDVVICAGGDGTIAAIADAIAGTQTALLPLPCGTMNLFCRDLGLPDDPVAAVSEGLGGAVRLVDIGIVEAAGHRRVFLNNIVFGPYAEIAVAREHLREAETIAKSGEAIVEAAAALLNSEPEVYSLELDGVALQIRTNTVVIANNLYSECVDMTPRRARLDGGVLGVYLAVAAGPGSFVARLIEFLDGTLENSSQIELYSGRQCRITRRDGDVTHAVDGERVDARGVADLTVAPSALRVLSPRRERMPNELVEEAAADAI